MATLQVREWSHEQWLAHESQWSALLSRSGLDPLFLSWEWLILWWQHFGGRKTHALCLLAVYRGEELAGIAPLYRLKTGRRLLPVRSLQFIGISWRDSTALISEYLDFICAPDDRREIRTVLADYLITRESWSELVISYSRDARGMIDIFTTSELGKEIYTRTVEECVSYQADLGDGFRHYLTTLGQSTRRSLWHLRRRLVGHGAVRLERLTLDTLADGFDDLNRLHALRWGQVAFSGDRLRFHLDLSARLVKRGELHFSRLWLDNQVVSVLYDIRKNHRQYNIKMGFDPSVERSFSLGLIHFGYAMETAAREGIQLYDFLAGWGRKTDYKCHLGKRQEQLATIQLLKGPLLGRLYRWHDRRKSKV